MLRGFAGAGHHAARWRNRKPVNLPLTASLPPLWTFSRASQGTQVQSGVLSTVGNNVARFETSPAGYLGEPQATNIIRNNTMVGAVAGVVGSGGALPTNWQIFAASGLTTTIIGTGTQNGVTYLDFRLSGTSTGTFYVLAFDSAGTTASVGQVWSESFWASYVAGSLTNVSTVQIDQRFTITVDTPFTLTTTLTRVSAVATAPSATTAYYPALLLTFPLTAAVDITLRIGLPQADLAGFTSSAIATTGTTATRAADNLTLDLTQLPGLQTAGGYGVAMDFSVISNSPGNTIVLGASINGDINNQWAIVTDGGGFMRVSSVIAGVTQYSAYLNTRAVGLTNRLALSVTPAGIRWSMNGVAVIGVTNAGQPLMGTLAVGRAAYSASAYTAMHATLVTLTPGPQSDAALIARAY